MLFGWAGAVLLALPAFSPASASADTIRISGTGGALETMRFIGEAFRKSHPDVQIVISPSMGSSGAVRAVLAGALDIGLCARPLKDQERAAGAVETRYARTPFVFGVNKSVERTGITLAGAVAIYWGRRDRWEDGSRIRLVLRPPEDSDLMILKAMAPEMNAAVENAMHRDGMLVAMTDQEAADAIEKVPGAFGGTTLSLVVSEKRAIGVLALNGIVPSVQTLADGTYPHAKTFHMVTRKNPDPAVLRFIEFVRSPASADILAKNAQQAMP